MKVTTVEGGEPSPVSLDIWHEVATSINSGAYAVLLAIAVVYVLTRRAIGKALDHHFALLEMLKDATGRNSQSIRIMAVTHRRLADHFMEKGENDNIGVIQILRNSEAVYNEQQHKEKQ